MPIRTKLIHIDKNVGLGCNVNIFVGVSVEKTQFYEKRSDPKSEQVRKKWTIEKRALLM